jgi:dTDP-4-dehydrorhamnose reductase
VGGRRETERALTAPWRTSTWAGIEPTVNRVADVYHDQLQLSGHWHRRSDSDLIAALGVGVIRYPLLWELVAPSGLDRADWRWFDERLGDLRRLGIRRCSPANAQR